MAETFTYLVLAVAIMINSVAVHVYPIIAWRSLHGTRACNAL